MSDEENKPTSENVSVEAIETAEEVTEEPEVVTGENTEEAVTEEPAGEENSEPDNSEPVEGNSEEPAEEPAEEQEENSEENEEPVEEEQEDNAEEPVEEAEEEQVEKVTRTPRKRKKKVDSDEEDYAQGAPSDDELATLDTRNIIPGGRRTRGKKIDFKKLVGDDDEDEDDE